MVLLQWGRGLLPGYDLHALTRRRLPKGCFNGAGDCSPDMTLPMAVDWLHTYLGFNGAGDCSPDMTDAGNTPTSLP